MKLNLGCGDKKKKGYINVDISPKCDPDVVADVTETPWEFADDVERIEFDNLLEHLTRNDVINVLNECHRVLKDGGTVWIKSPAIQKDFNYQQLDAVFGDPTHRSFFTERTFDYWNKKDPMNRWHNFGKDYGIKGYSGMKKEKNGLFIEVTLIK